MEKIEMKVELVNAILNYLASCPYGQVYELVAEIQKCEPVREKKEDVE